MPDGNHGDGGVWHGGLRRSSEALTEAVEAENISGDGNGGNGDDGNGGNGSDGNGFDVHIVDGRVTLLE